MMDTRATSPRLTLTGVWLGMLLVAGCTPPSITGEPLKLPTTGDAFEGVQCSAVRPQAEPDLMGWDPGSRANLSRLRGAGVVAVRYQAKGCNVELELLSHCIGEGSYVFAPYAAEQSKIARNEAELFAELPIGAAKLAAKVKGDRVLRTDYMLAGTVSLPPGTAFHVDKLRGGGCERATHVVSTIYLGGFAMAAGEERELSASASVFSVGIGAGQSASAERLDREGDPEACKVAQKAGSESPQCAVPLRIGLLALDGLGPPQPAPASSGSASAVTAPPRPVLKQIRGACEKCASEVGEGELCREAVKPCMQDDSCKRWGDCMEACEDTDTWDEEAACHRACYERFNKSAAVREATTCLCGACADVCSMCP